MMMHSTVLLRAEVKALQEANEVKKRRERKKKRRIAQGGSLTIQEGVELLQRDQIEGRGVVEERQPETSRAKQPRCSICGSTGYNVCTCQRHQESINN